MKKAQSLIEYALILFLISAVAVSTLHFLGKKMSLNNNESKINPKQTITETMTNYCEQKDMVYDANKETCISKK